VRVILRRGATADRYVWTRIRVSGSVMLPDFAKALGPVEPFIDLSSLAAG